jgi:flagellar FliJ protein
MNDGDRAQRLQPVARIADLRQQDAAAELRKSRETLRRYQDKLAEMRAYREDYLRRFQEQGAGGIRAEAIREFQAFLAKLDTTITQLEGLVEGARRQCDQTRNQWLKKRARSRALDGVLDRYRDRERLEERRREDRETDEHNNTRG